MDNEIPNLEHEVIERASAESIAALRRLRDILYRNQNPTVQQNVREFLKHEDNTAFRETLHTILSDEI